MCLDIAFYSALQLMEDYFPGLALDGEIHFDAETGAHFFAIGHRRYPVIIREKDQYHRKYFEWGIIAEYMNTPEKIKAMRKSMVNARSEKILEDKKSFWHRIRKTRCLIPVTGFYEHREIPAWKNKIPYYIRLRGRKMFCIPGLYHYNTLIPSDPETGEMRGMFVMVTRSANDIMRQIHNSGDNAYRMPLLLPEELERQWLNPNLTDEQLAALLQYEMPPGELEYHTVYSLRSRAPRPDGKPKIAPWEFPGLPPLGSSEGPARKSLF